MKYDQRISKTEKSINNIKKTIYYTSEVFSALGFDKEAICTLGDGMLIIQPAVSISNSEFSEQILTELIKEGIAGRNYLMNSRPDKPKSDRQLNRS